MPGGGRTFRRPSARVAKRGQALHRRGGCQRLQVGIRGGPGSRRRVRGRADRGGAAARATRDPDARPRPRSMFDRRPRGRAWVRRHLGCRVGPVWACRGGGGAQSRGRRDAAYGRASGAGARARVRHERRALRRRHARALERRQPGASRRRSPRGGNALREAARQRADARARCDEADRAGLPRGGIDAADRLTPRLFAGLFETEDLRNGIDSFLTEGPGKATFSGR